MSASERSAPRAASPYTAEAASADPRVLLAGARALDARGQGDDCVVAYERVVELAERAGEERVLAEALRRLGMVHFRQAGYERAAALLERSRDVATAVRDGVLVGEALNAIAVTHIRRGEWDAARALLERALDAGAESDELRGHIEQNLGTMANWQGDIDLALVHYLRSLDAYRTANDARGCAIANHNLGMNAADREHWEDAEAHFRASLETADTIGDVALRGHVLLNRTEVHLARARYEDARAGAEEALRIFDGLGAQDRKSAAYKYLGMLYRETGAPLLAEARLRTAMELARGVGAAADEAEAARELALTYRQVGRNQEALHLLNEAHRTFTRLNARRDLVDVASRVARLEETYFEIVRMWGRSIESTDSYTYGHSERVARYAGTLARTLGLEAGDVTAVRIGAHLHDVGKVRVPHEVLNKPGRLSEAEYAIMQLHTIYGIELLAGIDFPWDIRPMVRSHHERLDGTGYPDRLRGDEVPLHAQAICIVDVYDALTTTRSYRPAMDEEAALAEMRQTAHWWSRDVWEAFHEALAVPEWRGRMEE
jgi:putative nucleotidyltransferase with HDIG domain